MNSKIFISYSHKDIKKVKEFALLLSLNNFDIWMDEKNMASGDTYLSRIYKNIHSSDFYMVFISSNSVQSNWVNAEIDFALREKIENKHLIIIPVLLDDVEIPVTLSNILYLDARYSLKDACAEFSSKYTKLSAVQSGLHIASMAFTLSKNTAVEIGPFNDSVTEHDLKEDREHILLSLRKKAYGILMNFVDADNFDFESDTPKFTNGLYEEHIGKESGSTCGSIRELVSVETIVFQPGTDKIDALLSDRLDLLNISAISFGFTVPVEQGETMSDIGKCCFKKLQKNYIILSYDTKDGATIEYSPDFYLSLNFSSELMQLKLTTKYDFQLKDRIKSFSLQDFVKQLLP